MENVLDFARFRRMKFEQGKTDKELAALDFDQFGNPIPLERTNGNESNKEERTQETS